MNTLLNTSYRMARVNIPPLSLAANGVTVLAGSNTVAGNEYVLNGVSYLVVGLQIAFLLFLILIKTC